MVTPLLPPRGTSVKVSAYTGPLGSIVINTDTKTVHVQDGVTPGGIALAKVGHSHASNEVAAWLGYTPAALGVDGKLLPSQLPTIAITDTFVVDSEAEMLALSAERGDVAIRTDEGESYILREDDPSDLDSWQALPSLGTAGITSVNGQGGPTVTLTSSDISEGSNQYYTDARARAALSISAGSSGATYDSATGVLDLSALTAGGGGSGSVTQVTVTPANGVSATVANQGTTPALTISLGDITPSKVTASGNIGNTAGGLSIVGASTVSGTLAVSGTISAGVANFSGLVSLARTSIASELLVGAGQASSAGTVGQLLRSNGANTAPSWETFTGANLAGDNTWSGNNFFTSNTVFSGATACDGVLTTTNNVIVGGHLTMSANAKRFYGNYAGTAAQRQYFQHSANGNTILGALPGGSATQSQFAFFNAADPTAASYGGFGIDGSSVFVNSANTGGTTLPILFKIDASEMLRIGTNGAIGLGGANFGTAGQVITSGGSGTTPSWTTPFSLPSQTGNAGKFLTTSGTAASWSADGSALTNLNAANLASGTVPTARLGTGTASATTFLAGDQSYKTAVTAVTVTTANGVSAAVATQGTTPALTFTLGAITPSSVAATGAVSGSTISGDGSALTALNASNLGSGTVPTARLGSGTASSTTFLRGDGTWATPSGTGTVTSVTVANANGVSATVANQGTTPALTISLGAITPSSVVASGAISGSTVSGDGSGLTALNASNLGSGTVPVARLASSGTASATTFLRGDGTWATPATSTWTGGAVSNTVQITTTTTPQLTLGGSSGTAAVAGASGTTVFAMQPAVGSYFTLSTAASGNLVERLRVTTGGLVLINTTDAGSGAALLVTAPAAAGFPVLKIGAGGGSQVQSGILAFGNYNNTTNDNAIWRGAANSVSGGGDYLNFGSNAGLIFAASGSAGAGAQTERMRITSAGRVLIGTTDGTATSALTVSSAAAHTFIKVSGTEGLSGGISFGLGASTTNDCGAWRGASNSTSNTGDYLNLGSNAGIVLATGGNLGAQTVRATFDSSGATIAALAGSGSRNVVASASGVLSAPTSDRRLKTNIQDLDYGMAQVKALRPVSFEWNEANQDLGTGRQVGFIAQEVQEVVPEATGTIKDTGNMYVNDREIVAVLTAGLQKAYSLIEELTTRLAALEDKS